MLIPVDRNSSELLSVVVALENTDSASTPGSTYVPVVSVKYSLPPRLGISATCRLPPRLVWASRRRGICQAPRPQLVMGSSRQPVYRLQGCGTHSLSDTLAVSQLTCQEMRQQIQGLNIHSTQSVRRFQSVSSSTPTVPLSQRVYSSGDGGPASSPHPGGSQEVGAEVGGWDSRSSDLQKLKELELQGNTARPLSRSSATARGRDKVSVSYDPHIQEELRPLGGGGVGGSSSKQSLTLPPNGLRNHVLRAEHFLPPRSPHGPHTGPEEDVVAMGSLWGPSHQHLHTRGSSTVATSTTAITSSACTATKPLPASLANGGAFLSLQGSLPTRRPAPSATSTSLTLHHSASSSTTASAATTAAAAAMGNVVRAKDKEVEPKYSDPVPGAPASFQQRLMELAALEAETVRWERSKKVKKKPLKQDKDS